MEDIVLAFMCIYDPSGICGEDLCQFVHLSLNEFIWSSTSSQKFLFPDNVDSKECQYFQCTKFGVTSTEDN